MNAETTVLKITLNDGYHMKAYEIKNMFPHSNLQIRIHRSVVIKTPLLVIFHLWYLMGLPFGQDLFNQYVNLSFSG